MSRVSFDQVAAAPRPGLVAIDDGWRQWIAENRLRDCAPDSMVQTMVQAGVHPEVARLAVAQMETDPVFKAARRHQQLLKKLESMVLNQQRVWEMDPAFTQVDKRSGLTSDEFMTRYVQGSRPVVLTDLAADWPAMHRWSPADLKRRFGHLEVEIQAGRSADPRYEQNKVAHKHRSRLDVFVDQVLRGGPTNDYYLTANNELLREPAFAPLLDDIGSLPAFCDRTRLAQSSSFWFGPAGTVTPLHHDPLMLMHTQVVGRKRWRFISPLQTPLVYNQARYYSPVDLDAPDLARYPRFKDATVLDVVVEPGETIFLPLAWWHQVTSLDVCLSFSFSCMAFPNSFSYDNPEIWDW